MYFQDLEYNLQYIFVCYLAYKQEYMQVAFEANSHNIALYIYYEGKFREKLVFGNTSV